MSTTPNGVQGDDSGDGTRTGAGAGTGPDTGTGTDTGAGSGPAAPVAKPLYVHASTVWFDELDMLGVLHNARYAIHVERAMTAWFHSVPGIDPADSYGVVKHYGIEFVRPFTRERGELVVEMSLVRVGTTSAVIGFRCVSHAEDGTEVEHARGTRTIVKVSPGNLRPTPWSDGFRQLTAAAAA